MTCQYIGPRDVDDTVDDVMEGFQVFMYDQPSFFTKQKLIETK